MALVRQVRNGRETWVEVGPDTCRNGHPGPVSTWQLCEACGYACTHWLCRDQECDDAAPDVEHVHRG